ncbi:hypothetical protein [Microcoleus sp. D3_18_C4]|uniref:hypothetical protein n=1 Tax=Microcoleus sp. D3_18_C4 TaxID=3055335 RepID=UPI002FD3EAB4
MISVILNVYKRNSNLERQINALIGQTVQIEYEDIHVWYNHIGLNQHLPQSRNIKTYVCSWNTKFHGRFLISLLVKTPFVAVLDDDIIPGNKWFENCLNSINNVNGILGGSGVILKAKAYRPNLKIGWNGVHSPNNEKVDLVGQTWFFRQEWAKYLWYEEPLTWNNGEDIMFSYLAQKHGGISSFVPPHPEQDKELWSNVPERDCGYGTDENASFLNASEHFHIRDGICQRYIDMGWKTVNNIK